MVAAALAATAVLATGCGQEPPPVSEKVQAYYDANVAPQADGPTPEPSATVSAEPAPTITIPAGPRLQIVGDSYSAGVGAKAPESGWATIVAESLGYPYEIDGVGGTGFAWGGGENGEANRQYSVRLEELAAGDFDPNLLILQGGQNDSRLDDSEITAAVTATIEQARELWPGVQVVVMGPSAPQPLASNLRNASNAVEAGAEAAAAPFVNPIDEDWFTMQNSPGFDFDGSHVNDGGHAHIAQEFLEDWATITS